MSDPTEVSRRLVAVFAADVEGYSRLMGADEVGTLKDLTERGAGQWQSTISVSVEIEHEPKPALVAEWLTLNIL